MSGAFPGASNIDALWELLISGRDGISTLSREELLASGENPALLDDPAYVPRGGFLDGAECFDNDFFAVTPGEALLMDPQQRLFLQHARLALNDAGLPGDAGKRQVGVFAGASTTQYWFLLREGPYTKSLEDFRLMLGNEKDYIATRASYKLNLRGPSVNVQSACSTSMSAVALACQSLLTWGCDLALAGGVSVGAPRKLGYVAYEGMIVSPTGVCRPFDSAADGTLFGEGVGVVCLKRLSEAIEDDDYIYAVIDGVGMSNDGSDKVGFTAPSASAQAEAIELAQALAGVTPDEIGFVEAHGTATPLGDPIEISALTQAFRKETKAVGYCRLGSVKSNIGHLDAAAGIASLIKTVLAVNRGIIPPTLNFNEPNPHLDLYASPFTVNVQAVEWQPLGGKRCAGVSSTGVGGTNVHAIVSSPPPRVSKFTAVESPPQPLLLSGKCRDAVGEYAKSAAEYLRKHPEIDTVSFIAKIRRSSIAYPWRKGFPCMDRDALIEELSRPIEGLAPSKAKQVIFAFPGQGSQFPVMARAYYGKLPRFTNIIDKGLTESERLGRGDLKSFLLEDDTCERSIARTEITQPLLYIIEFALAQELLDRGIIPDAVVGHSIGEYAAAAVSGVFSFEEGLRLVVQRGFWMQRAPEGAMVAVSLPEAEARRFVGDNTYVAVVNTATQTVLSGNFQAVEDLEQRLADKGINYTRLKTSHAFHSPLMDGILEAFREETLKTQYKPGTIPMFSNIDGKPMTATPDWSDYWVRQLREPVRFDLCSRAITEGSAALTIEVGPGRALTGFLKTNFPENEDVYPILPNAKTVSSYFERSLIRLWERGVNVNWPEAAILPDTPILFPGYPFAQTRFWPRDTRISRAKSPLQNEVEAGGDASTEIPLNSQQDTWGRITSIWREVLGHGDFTNDTNFFLCGGDSFAGIQLLRKLKTVLELDLKMPELLVSPTIKGIAAHINPVESVQEPSNRRDNPFSRFLFPIQTNGKAPALFMVAGAHENRYYDPEKNQNSYEEDFYRYFSILIKTLGGDQPLYGFKPKGLVMTEPLHSSVIEMADAYIRAMKEEQPVGPYFIGGECVGGIVAQEMARQLEEKGEKVARLFLLDTPKPGFVNACREMLISFRRNLRSTITKMAYNLKTLDILSLTRELQSKLAIWSILLFPLGRARARQKRSITGSATYLWILLMHRVRPSTVPVVYIINRDWNAKKFLMGWGRELGTDIRCIEVPGYHWNRLGVSGAIIGRKIREEIGTLDQAEGTE